MPFKLRIELCALRLRALKRTLEIWKTARRHGFVHTYRLMLSEVAYREIAKTMGDIVMGEKAAAQPLNDPPRA